MEPLLRLTAPSPVGLLLGKHSLRLLLYLQLSPSIQKHLDLRTVKVFQGILSYERDHWKVCVLQLLLMVLMPLVGQDAIDVKTYFSVLVIHHVINNLNVRWLVQVLSLLICPNIPITIIFS